MAVTCILQKSRPSSNVKVKGQGHRDKKRQSAVFCSGAGSPCGIFSGAVLGGAVLYAGGKISACRLVVFASVATDCTTVFLYFSKRNVNARRTTARTTVAVVERASAVVTQGVVVTHSCAIMGQMSNNEMTRKEVSLVQKQASLVEDFSKANTTARRRIVRQYVVVVRRASALVTQAVVVTHGCATTGHKMRRKELSLVEDFSKRNATARRTVGQCVADVERTGALVPRGVLVARSNATMLELTR